MRWLVALVVVISACGHGTLGGATCTDQGHTYRVGDMFPAGDGCNFCTCTASGVGCTARGCALDAGVDAAPGSCTTQDGCPGAVCGALCCPLGEHCDNGTCRCGSGAGCPSGDMCAAPGPIGTNACGSICCGATGPCPQ